MTKKLSIEEKEEIIERGFRSGATYAEMQKRIGEKSSYTVNKVRKKLLSEGRITEQAIADAKMERQIIEWKNDKQFMKVLEYTKAGLSQMSISFLMGCSYDYVRDCIKNLKKIGLITDEAIAKAREEYKKEEKEDSLVREQVLEFLKKGITKNQFAGSIGRSERGVYYIEQDLIREKKIEKQETDEAVNTYGREAQKRNQVIELLKKGYTYSEISREVDYGIVTIKKIKQEFIDASDFSEEQYQKLRKKRQEENKNNADVNEKNDLLEDEVLQLLRRGKTADIIKKKTKLPTCDIKIIINRLKRQKRITQEEIREAVERDKQETERMILEFLREGYSQRTIAAKFPEDEMTLDMVQTYIKRIKESGKITENEIKKYKDEAAKRRQKKSRDFVLKGLKGGLSRVKIAESSKGHLSEDMVRDIIKKLKEDGTITQEKILEWKDQKKKKDQRIEEEKRGEIDRQIIDLYDRGYLQQEIADEIGKSLRFVGRRMKAIKEERQFNKEKIKKARLEREKEQKLQQTMKEKEKQKEEKRNQKYTGLLESARKMILLEKQYSPKLCNNLLVSMQKKGRKGELLKEDLDVLAQLVLLEEQKIKNVLSVGKLYANMRNYKGGLQFLKQGIDFFEGEERSIIEEAISSMKHSLALEKAVELIYSGECTIQEVCTATSLLETEVLPLCKKVELESVEEKGA